MSVVILLIAASLTVAVGFLMAFIWSVKSGQYDDDYTPSVRMLFDDMPPQVSHSDGAGQEAALRDAALRTSLTHVNNTSTKPIQSETTNPKQ